MNRLGVAALYALFASPLAAEQILYLGSADGRLLGSSGSTATLDQALPRQTFTAFFGYGALRQDGQCLTSRKVGADVTWQNCVQGDPAQIWRLQSRRLTSLAGVCAEYSAPEDNAPSAVKAMTCSKKPEQLWQTYGAIAARIALKEVADESLRTSIDEFARQSAAGEQLTLTDQQRANVPDMLVLDDRAVTSAGKSSLVYRIP